MEKTPSIYLAQRKHVIPSEHVITMKAGQKFLRESIINAQNEMTAADAFDESFKKMFLNKADKQIQHRINIYPNITLVADDTLKNNEIRIVQK